MHSLYQTLTIGTVIAFAFAPETRATDDRDRIPVLVQSLANPNVRYGASVALKRLGAEAVPALRRALDSTKGDLRVWCAFTLGEIGPDARSAVGDLTKSLKSPDAALRAAAAQALGKIGPSSALAVKPLTAALADNDPAVRACAVVALGQIGPAAKTSTARLIRALSDSRLRDDARTAIVRIGGTAVKPLLGSLKNDEIRFDVAQVLLRLDPKAAERAGLAMATAADLTGLRLVLNDPTRNSEDRTAAASALASLGSAGVPVLIGAFGNKQASRTAALAFAKVGSVGVPALIKALADDKPEIRATAADSLSHIGPGASAATPHLIKRLTDKDREIRYRVVRALHAFGQKAAPAVPALITVIANGRESEPTRQWAIKTLVVTLPKTRAIVVKALIEASKDKRNYGVSQLARQHVRQIAPKAAAAAGVK